MQSMVRIKHMLNIAQKGEVWKAGKVAFIPLHRTWWSLAVCWRNSPYRIAEMDRHGVHKEMDGQTEPAAAISARMAQKVLPDTPT